MSEDKARAVNAAIARNYDALVYDPQPNALLDPDRVCGLAAMFGSVRDPVDVLDLGCGTGAQLLQAAAQVRGKLVGTDISSEACRRAAEKLSPFADRTRIECADLLELDAAALGEFDLIYNIGVIYVTPPEVQRRILELIGQCLRPGGVAVISYYSGSMQTLRANLHRVLRAGVQGLLPEPALLTAREQLAALAQEAAAAPGMELLQAAIAQTSRLPDLIFFHEVLNNAFEPMSTLRVEQELSGHGIGFADYIKPVCPDPALSSGERALAAERAGLMGGQYRYAVFAKAQGERPTRLGDVKWSSCLTRSPHEASDEGQLFEGPDGSIVTAHRPATAALLDSLIEEDLSSPEAVDRVTAALAVARNSPRPEELRAMEADLRELWRHGLVFPLLNIP